MKHPDTNPCIAQSETLLRQADAARMLNISERTLEAWRHRGGGPQYLKLNRCVRYRHSELERWLNLHLEQSSSRA